MKKLLIISIIVIASGCVHNNVFPTYSVYCHSQMVTDNEIQKIQLKCISTNMDCKYDTIPSALCNISK